MGYHSQCNATFVESLSHAQENLPHVNLPFRVVLARLSYVCTVIVLLSCLILAITHLACYTIPREQKLILRVIALPPIFAICNLLAIAFYNASIYIAEIPQIVEAVALCAVFNLCVEFLTGESTRAERDAYFQSIQPPSKEHTDADANAAKARRFNLRACLPTVKKRRDDKAPPAVGSLHWFKTRLASVFQYLPVMLVFAIITWILAIVECPDSTSATVSSFIVSGITSVSISFSIYSIIMLQHRFKTELKPLGARRKLWTMKLLIGWSVTLVLTFALISWVLPEEGKTTPHLSYYDITIGVPNALFELSMVIFCPLFWWAYPAKRYRTAKDPSTGRLRKAQPVWRAIIDTINPSDIIEGTAETFLILWHSLPWIKKHDKLAAGNVGDHDGAYLLKTSPEMSIPQHTYQQVPGEHSYPPEYTV